jgi:galactose oxidase-like protein/Kelch motif protein
MAPTLFSRRRTRIAFLLGLVVVAVSILSSTSLASSISQKFFARAAAIVTGAQMAPASHAVSIEEAAAPAVSTTMLVERRGHTAMRLADGRVLIAGGENSTGTLNETELYDPSSGSFSAAANMATARADHSTTLLADGRVLIAGGNNGGTSVASTEIFDPATGAFTSGPSMSVARAGHSATLFANGRVLIAGGDAAGTAEIFDPTDGTFATTGSLGVARSMHSAALLQDGRVLVVGGRDGDGNALTSGEIFDTPAGAFSNVDSALKVARVRAHLRVLFDGKVQIIGGSDDGSMELYDPVYEGFGGYAHVLPEGDTCAGLVGQIQNSQTRAALFHNGQSDALFDRSGHTITELNGQALVLGGANSSGAALNSSALLSSSGASISTDKMDYAPGETAHISGRGYQPGEVVRVKIHEDPHTPQERGFDVTADADGNFTGDYLVMEYDLDMKFIVGARGLTSGATAQTTMTDSNPQSISVAAPTSVTVIQGATAAYGNVTVLKGGNNNLCGSRNWITSRRHSRVWYKSSGDDYGKREHIA